MTKKNPKLEAARIVRGSNAAPVAAPGRAHNGEPSLSPPAIQTRLCTVPSFKTPMLILPQGIYSFVRHMPDGRMVFESTMTQEVLLLTYAELREFMGIARKLLGKPVPAPGIAAAVRKS